MNTETPSTLPPRPVLGGNPVASPPSAPVASSPTPVETPQISSRETLFADAYSTVQKIVASYDAVMVGQDRLKESLLIGLLANGHILLESVPGLAKTTAAHTIASSMGGKFSRIQCTPDLLPADIIGTEIYNPKTGDFSTELGPVHSNFVLLDEINRSSAKTQSAMLEAMQERQTSIAGVNHKLPEPFLVIATQNPIEQEGTYQLAEAQLDRFFIKETLTYSSNDEELEMLRRFETGQLNQKVVPVVSVGDVLKAQQAVRAIHIEESIQAYIVNLVQATRNVNQFLGENIGSFVEYGASPRASLALLSGAKASAFLRGREAVIPEDVKNIASRVLNHRIVLKYNAYTQQITSENIVNQLLNTIPSP